MKITVQPHERVLVHRDGALVDVLGPGRHRLRRRRTVRHVVDVRERLLGLATQEVPTSDGLRVKVGATLTWRVVDPVAWHAVALDPKAVVYEAARRAVRDVVAASDLAGLASGVPEDDVPAALAAAMGAVGVEATSLRVTDVLPPAEVRRAVEAAEVARHRAVAALEEARGQSAAVRHLANVADVLDHHPALAALRLPEVAAAGGGSVVVERPSGAAR